MPNISESNTTKTNITKDYSVDYEPVEKTAFAEFIRKKRKEYNEKNGKKLSTSELGTMIGIKSEMFRKILNQEKPTKKRDCIIAICVALQLFPGDIDDALELYQYMPVLDQYNRRDGFITSQIIGTPSLSVAELNQRLIKRGFPGLDIQDKRDGNKKNIDGVVLNLPYKVIELKVRTPIDSDYYYGDPHNSLSTKYDPFNCRCTGEMILSDSKIKKYIHLIASTDGYMSSQIYKVEDFPNSYKTLEDTGNYKNYFIELINAVNVEKRRLLSILNDTKNYQHRTSARLIGDSICIFTEQFNYSIPEMNEYYILTLSDGKYKLHVFDRSAFMQFYLSSDAFNRYYGTDELTAKETYDSIEQLDALIQKADKYSDKTVIYRMRKNALTKLQPYVDNLYSVLKDGKEFIQNLEYIYENPTDTLRYYKLEKDYECVYDDEYGEICDSLREKNYKLPDGTEIAITLNDIFTAFKLGFPNIEEICRIKAKYGSIEAVLA
ncbi:MAG: hypothetical protein PHX08_09775 [Lachnospiraceae bacterium]|nr:hypothetical protein [Lachnospiraceae bacterium]